MNFTPEMIDMAKNAKSVEELLALAKENNAELSEESAKAYFEAMNKSGELSDDELDNVAGGRCYHGSRPVVTVGEYHHDCYKCKHCREMEGDHECSAKGKKVVYALCGECMWCVYEDALWLCDNPEKRK